MWQAHGGRDRFAVWLGLADQTCCPTTQGRWGRDRSLRLRFDPGPEGRQIDTLVRVYPRRVGYKSNASS